MPKSIAPRPITQNVMVRISKNQYENKLIRLMDEKGFFTVSETIRFCIEHTFSDIFPAYLERKKQQTSSPITSGEMYSQTRNQSLIEELDGFMLEDGKILYRQFEEGTVGAITVKKISINPEDIGHETVKYQYRDALGNTGSEAKKRILSLMENNK